jgi:hypothetical protein
MTDAPLADRVRALLIDRFQTAKIEAKSGAWFICACCERVRQAHEGAADGLTGCCDGCWSAFAREWGEP